MGAARMRVRSFPFGVGLPFATFLLIASVNVTTTKAQGSDAAKCPPVARVDNVTENVHGTMVTDPYRWLEDQNSPETRAWIAAENKCTDAVLDKLPAKAPV